MMMKFDIASVAKSNKATDCGRAFVVNENVWFSNQGPRYVELYCDYEA